MEISRNQYFMVGLVILFLGIQFRLVDSVVLNEPTTKYLAQRSKNTAVSTSARFLPAVGPPARKIIHPPQWLGWALMSVGSVLILHSLALRQNPG